MAPSPSPPSPSISPSVSTSSTNVDEKFKHNDHHRDSPIMSGEVEKGFSSHHDTSAHGDDESMVMKDVGVVGVPRRKPVPPPVPPPKDTDTHCDVNGPAAAAGGVGAGFASATFMEKLKLKLGLLDGTVEERRKRKRVLIALGVAVIFVLAIIIGLAAGLSGNNRNESNLPLPTGNGGPYTGDLTYYEPALGSCGITSSASENICAVSKDLYDAVSTGSDPNQNPLCGLKIRLRRNGRSVDVTVVDRCVGCKPTDIDVSMSVFEKLALVEQGRVLVDWAWIDETPFEL